MICSSPHRIDVVEDVQYEAFSVLLKSLMKAEVSEINRKDLVKLDSSIVKELLELRGMIG